MIQNLISRNFTKIICAALVVAMTALLASPKFISAAGITAAKDTATRLEISTTADHVFTFTLPTGVDFDSTTQTDALQFDFPSTFTLGGTWATADFAFNDGTSRTINAVAQGGGTIDCTVASGVNNVCVAVDTTAKIFTVKPSANYTASATGATVTFTILGTAGNGTLTNPSSVAATNIAVQQCDETASCTTTFTVSYLDTLAYGIADSDQVTVSATVNSTITFDLDAKSDFSANASNAPYTVHLGTLSTGSVTHSDTSSVEMIVVNSSTNASSGVNVTIQNANGTNGLVSSAVPADKIPSATATMAAGTANYGLCVDSATLSGFTRSGSYTTTCALASGTNQVVALSTTPANLVSTSAPVSNAKAELVVNAAISGSTPSHSDYADTLTFIGTGTF